MNHYLIDTNILIAHFRGNEQASRFIEASVDEIVLSTIVIGELYQGVNSKRHLKTVAEFIEPFPVLQLYEEVDITALALQQKYAVKYKTGFIDMVLAAQAILTQMTLVTFNQKDFVFVEKLDLLVPQ